MRKISIFFLFAISLLITTGCSVNRNKAVAYGTKAATEWTNVYGSVNLTSSSPMSMSFSGRTTMENGKYINVSLRVFGMEAAVFHLDNDSVYFVDKYHKYFFAEPLKVVLGSKYGNLDIADIQKIIFGQTKVPESEKIIIRPEDFVSTPAGEVASVLQLFSETPHGKIEGVWKWKPADAKWNEPDRKANFKCPDNYRRITIESLESLFKSLNM